jgi:hypothetical protein
MGKFIDFIEKKFIRKNKGILVFYMTFDPTLEGPNVLSYTINPEMKQVKEIEEALKHSADMIRKYYRENPEKLDFVIQVMKESGYST